MALNRDPRTTPAAGDRWRDSWGTRMVHEGDTGDGLVEMADGEVFTLEDWRWTTRPVGGWVFVGERGAP